MKIFHKISSMSQNWQFLQVSQCINLTILWCSRPMRAIVVGDLSVLLNIIFHAPMGIFQLELTYFIIYFSTVVPFNSCSSFLQAFRTGDLMFTFLKQMNVGNYLVSNVTGLRLQCTVVNKNSFDTKLTLFTYTGQNSCVVSWRTSSKNMP